jgi:hypothetical protein
MQEGEIEIIVAINDAKKTSPWTESKNKLFGTLGKYHIVIAGFYKRKKDSKILQYRVLCPYAIGFDYTFEQ